MSCSRTCRVGKVMVKIPFFGAGGVRERQVQLSHTANTMMSVIVGPILTMQARKLRRSSSIRVSSIRRVEGQVVMGEKKYEKGGTHLHADIKTAMAAGWHLLPSPLPYQIVEIRAAINEVADQKMEGRMNNRREGKCTCEPGDNVLMNESMGLLAYHHYSTRSLRPHHQLVERPSSPPRAD